MSTWRLLLFLAVSHSVQGVEVVGLEMPVQVKLGGLVTLRCLYHLRGDTLYAIKWYKDGTEFLRLTPRDGPLFYPTPGLDLKIENTTRDSVVLARTYPNTTGLYSCEVTGEAPFFSLAFSQPRRLTVIALPQRGPVILGGRERYKPGDKVRLTCRAGPSLPAPNITWYLNGQKVSEGLTTTETGTSEDGLQWSEGRLELLVRESHLEDGELRFKCIATISNLYWNSTDVPGPGAAALANPPSTSAEPSTSSATLNITPLHHLLLPLYLLLQLTTF